MKFTIDENGCWNFNGPLDKDGYGKVQFRGFSYRAHRMMAHLTIKCTINETELVAHKCDNPRCINPEHLFFTSPLGNMRDRDEKGRGAIGERHPFSKLKAKDIISIRDQYAKGKSFAKIAVNFPVSIATISAIVKRETWKHIH